MKEDKKYEDVEREKIKEAMRGYSIIRNDVGGISSGTNIKNMLIDKILEILKQGKPAGDKGLEELERILKRGCEVFVNPNGEYVLRLWEDFKVMGFAKGKTLAEAIRQAKGGKK